VRVIVTGAAGFLGRLVVARLSRDHEVVQTDIVPCPDDAGVIGDLRDAGTLERLFAQPCDAVIHLATLPGGACESDPEQGWKVNIEGTRALLAAALRAGVARFLYASSIAIFGDVAGRSQVDDETPLSPVMLYAGHKAMIETWLATLGRRGALWPLSLRLPGLVARPGDGGGLKSAFMSDVFRAGAEGRAVTLPVSPDATMWLMSGQCAADNLARALAIPVDLMPVGGSVTLPALRVRMADLVAAIGRHLGTALHASYVPEREIERDFGSYPPLRTTAAEALGLAHDGDLDALVTAAMKSLT
jgi:nucleoside-diphosphate-sugar epimerase